MNARHLLAEFDRLIDSPETVGLLREFTFELAVRGKLVAQDPNDEPASVILERLRGPAGAVRQTGRRRPQNPILPIRDEELPYVVPSTWIWARLPELAPYIQRGKSPDYVVSGGSPVVSQKCVQWVGLDLSVAKQVSLSSLKSYEEERFLHDGDLLWNSTGTGTIGRVVRVVDPPPRLVCDSHVTVVRCVGVSSEYVRTWLRSNHVFGVIEDRASGSTNQVELTAQMTHSQIVPLAPLAEQGRIVSRVDELMALCDQLEQSLRERQERSRELFDAVLHGSLRES